MRYVDCDLEYCVLRIDLTFTDNGNVFLVSMVCFASKLLMTGYNSGRYIILLMGAFSMYTGFLYNDIFSKTLHLFPSGWDFPEGNGTVVAVANGGTYLFGLDPGWHGADNALLLTNSYKMKMSIVLGVIHVGHQLMLLAWNMY